MKTTFSRRVGTVVLGLFLGALAGGCVSTSENDVSGTQPGYRSALGFTRIMFLPAFVISDPAKRAVVDNAAVLGDRVLEVAEKAVVESFRGQPGVPGYSPTAVRTIFAKDPEALTNVSGVFLSIQQKVIGRTDEAKGQFSRDCLRAETVLPFTLRCLIAREEWREAVSRFSTVGMNADAMLLVMLSSVEKNKIGNKYSLAAGATVMLIDASNGRLIWGREVTDRVESDLVREGFPEWSVLFARMFSEPFWMDFPGRLHAR